MGGAGAGRKAGGRGNTSGAGIGRAATGEGRVAPPRKRMRVDGIREGDGAVRIRKDVGGLRDSGKMPGTREWGLRGRRDRVSL